ncbi:DUF3108 domain-containing protein [Rhizobium sp. LjRoot30]|uniref:DUF3108 domain-containing protein n=1 Tax=Rhizobium sp. LjRoot30 TaxID=3342320 RepID=UPI003ECEBFC3
MAMIAVRCCMMAVMLMSCLPAKADEIHHEMEYSVALSGLPIARASFSTSLDKKRYKIDGTIYSAGIANLITRISAQTTVSGTVSADRFQARNYLLNYTSGKKTRVYEVNFRNGNVTSNSITPEPRRNPDNWVPVTGKDLRAVLDPISGIILPASKKACPARLPIFDGETRMDLVLTPKASKPFSTKGFKGDAIVCSVRFVPKAGFKKNRKDIDYLKKLKTMEIWFAKADPVNVYAPVYVKIPTEYGMLTVSAVRFGGNT